MWGEYARPYHRLLIEAAQDPYKRQTGWMTRIHPLALPSGRLMLPLYSDGFNLSLVALSDDQGQWRASSPIVGLGPIQPSLVLKKDGSIAAFCRDAGGPPQRVQKSVSQDSGESWTVAQDIEVPNPGSSLEVIALQDGSWLMVCNDTEMGRHRLSSWVSRDEGESWERTRTLEQGATGRDSFGYPSVIQTQDRLIHATYTCSSQKGNTIRHAVLDPQWILDKD
jgi:predicted neuraminidase